jgi:glycosyltransferase involved in cell wall biosynthesis
LLYRGDDPQELVRQIKRVLVDVDLRNRLIRNARQKVRAFHTSEIRLRQILDWISDGRIPRYS